MDAIDQTSSILLEGTIGHHSLLATTILIVDRDDQWIIVLNRLCKFKCSHVIHIKENLTLRDFLIDTWFYSDILNIILSVGRIEHLWCIVSILFLCHACVNTNVCVAKSVILESDFELRIFCKFLLKKDMGLELKSRGYWMRNDEN